VSLFSFFPVQIKNATSKRISRLGNASFYTKKAVIKKNDLQKI